MKTVLAYVPVLHRGYVDFFKRHGGPKSALYIFGRELIERFDFFRKDIRALDPHEAAKTIKALDLFGSVMITDDSSLELLSMTKRSLIMPDEDVSRAIAQESLAGCGVTFDAVFLRWDSKSSVRKCDVKADRTVSREACATMMMRAAQKEGEKSSDWWRHVGAIVARGEETILVAYNHHVPSPHMPYAFGDPRSYFKKSINIEISTAFHAEASAIASAAANGINLSSADIYTTTFPCPPCAKLIAYSGIKRLLFKDGYSMLDAQDILRSKGIEIVRVTDLEKNAPLP